MEQQHLIYKLYFMKGAVGMHLVQIGAAMELSTYLETLGTIVSKFMSWAVDVLGIMTGNPIMLVPFGAIAVFTAIKILKQIF